MFVSRKYKNKYKYFAYDLEGKKIMETTSIHDMAERLNVSECTITKRLRKKVHINSTFLNNKHKFNIERITV